MLFRSETDLDLFNAFKPIFQTVAMAKVGASAEESRELGFLRRSDLVSMNRDRLVADAKQTALALVRAGYTPPAVAPTAPSIRVLGEQLLNAGKLEKCRRDLDTGTLEVADQMCPLAWALSDTQRERLADIYLA